MSQILHIFRAGRHRAMDGREYAFSDQDVAATATAYDPALHQAPIVVGHPRTDDPAYGWIDSLSARGADLEASAERVEPEFAELVRQGRYRRISAAFYPPEHPSNPKPGVYYLKHVGFLGAAPPAVKGLRPAELSGDEAGVVVFGDWSDREAAGLWRRLREWLLSQFGQDTADQVVPAGSLESLQYDAMQPEPETSTYAEHAEETAVTKQLEDREQQINERARALEAREQQVAAAERAQAEAESARRRAECAAFVEAQAAAGRVLPREQPALVELLAALPETTIEFAEGDGQVQKPAADWLRGFVESLPPRVDFSERAAADGGRTPEPADDQISRRARAYREQRRQEGVTMSFTEAVDAVRAGRDRDGQAAA